MEPPKEIIPILNFQNISLPNISEVNRIRIYIITIKKNWEKYSVTLVNEKLYICFASLGGYVHLT